MKSTVKSDKKSIHSGEASHFRKAIRFLSSLKLAVLIIVGLGIISAVGTIIESRYDTETAQKLIYHSWYMWVLLSLLATVLIAVMVDRWPWKSRHIGFLFAHSGIILLLVGAYITHKWGIDGTMRFEIGEENRFVFLNENELTIYRSSELITTKVYSTRAEFLSSPPEEKNPKTFSTPIGTIFIEEFYPYALEDQKWLPSDNKKDGPALRFQLENPFVNMTEWISKEREELYGVRNLGPARIVLTLSDQDYVPLGGHELVLRSNGDALSYKVYTKEQKQPVSSGEIRAGQTLEPGWMKTVFRVLKYLPSAKRESQFKKLERPNGFSRAAIRVRHKDQTEWLGKNSVLKLYDDGQLYYLAYGRERFDLGFPLKLLKFEIGRYQGTRMAMSYESEVELEDGRKVLISMNEPLKHHGYTFYQASFEEDSMGKPRASILSVNWDPGRWLKYFGSLLIVLGAFYMAYLRKINKKIKEK